MIFYYSGTGNSAYVAKNLGESLREKVVRISDSDALANIVDGNSVGFVFPVHAWGPALPVISFIEYIDDKTVSEIRQRPVWIVMTCGDETGNAPLIIEKSLHKRGIDVAGIWSVIMPNTYVLLPGFDVDSKEVENRKLEGAPSRLEHIAEKIRKGEWDRDITYGSMPRLKSSVYPLFRRWGIFPKKWKASDSCIGCGICSRNCPEKNIVMEKGKPRWDDNCVSCLACYHSCPKHAVEYGNITRKKGQYGTLLSR